MKPTHLYERDETRVVLNTSAGPRVIAVATSAGWAAVICDDLNRTQEEKAS